MVRFSGLGDERGGPPVVRFSGLGDGRGGPVADLLSAMMDSSSMLRVWLPRWGNLKFKDGMD